MGMVDVWQQGQAWQALDHAAIVDAHLPPSVSDLWSTLPFFGYGLRYNFLQHQF